MRSLSATEKLMPSPCEPSRRVVSYISTSGFISVRRSGMKFVRHDPAIAKSKLGARLPARRQFHVDLLGARGGCRRPIGGALHGAAHLLEPPLGATQPAAALLRRSADPCSVETKFHLFFIH